ncbi:hypothetical protein FG2_1742 [Lactococcus cremoris]|nr:hypothetical protein AB995_1505 [Lactococcus cremoris]KZK34474.1 hypothetical protein LMG6897_2224 [Lactococcus cremoris]KZK45315.1 hypothetical protein FG2_1742 [Lactococcus cremoris]
MRKEHKAIFWYAWGLVVVVVITFAILGVAFILLVYGRG